MNGKQLDMHHNYVTYAFITCIYSVEKPNYQKQKSTGTQQLLAWCQHKTRYYEVWYNT